MIKKRPNRFITFSIEFLPGRLLQSNLLNLGILDVVEGRLHALELHPQKIFLMQKLILVRQRWTWTISVGVHGCDGQWGWPAMAMAFVINMGYLRQPLLTVIKLSLPDDWMRSGFPWETRRRIGRSRSNSAAGWN